MARSKLTRSQFTSDLSSTEDEQRRRRVRPNRYVSESDSDDDSQRKKIPRKDLQWYPVPPSDFPASTLSERGGFAKPKETAPETTGRKSEIVIKD